MTKSPYCYQRLVYDHIRANRDVLLQAPPGGGKTRAALEPGLDGLWDANTERDPQKILYAVPMRTLAKGFYQEKQASPAGQPEKGTRPIWTEGWQAIWNPTIQTGEMPTDPLLEGRVIFLTVDQLLASFLNLPYGLPQKLDNINAGALIGSYLIFDEFHLYPANQMMLTVLALCKMLKSVSRFILMSATFSAPFLKAIADQLGAVTVADQPGLNLFRDVTPVQTQHRTWHAVDDALTVEAVLARRGKRTLCICNQVERAQQLYHDLRQRLTKDVECTLLHSQFYRDDRQSREALLNKESFEGDDSEKVIVATQVVEVGLDLSATTLLTECAPAASLIQRAGRCARRENQQGNVYVFQPLDADGQINYAPYGNGRGEDQLLDVCERTWSALNDSDFQGHVIGYRDEQQLIDQAHGEADAAFVEGLRNQIDRRIDEITQCMANRHDGYLSTLVREQTSVPMFIHSNPNDDDVLTTHPHQRESFGVSRGRLFHYFRTLLETNPETEGEFWFMGCTGQPQDPTNDTDNFEPPKYKWYPIQNTDDFYRYRWFVAHPSVVDYDPEHNLGLRFRVSERPARPSPEGSKRSYEYKPYVADTYVQHLTGLHLAYIQGNDTLIPLSLEAAYGLKALCERMDVTAEMGKTLLQLTLALHDVGKLNQRWQSWATTWQDAYAQQIAPPTASAADGPLAHTDYDRRDRRQENLKKTFKHPPRGPHAVESAEASLPIIREVCQGNRQLMALVVTAIMRHHTPDADHCDDFKLADDTRGAVADVLNHYGFRAEAERWSQMINSQFRSSGKQVQLSPNAIQASYHSWNPTLLYLLFVRILRLADQRSGEYWHRYRSMPIRENE